MRRVFMGEEPRRRRRKPDQGKEEDHPQTQKEIEDTLREVRQEQERSQQSEQRSEVMSRCQGVLSEDPEIFLEEFTQIPAE